MIFLGYLNEEKVLIPLSGQSQCLGSPNEITSFPFTFCLDEGGRGREGK